MSAVDTTSSSTVTPPLVPPLPPLAPPPAAVAALNPNDLPVLHSSYHLNGKNYLQWAQVIRTTLKGRRRLSHIVGDPPTADDPQFAVWDDEDSLIMTWLWNSMIPEISKNCMFFASAREIWDSCSQSFSMKQDVAACYELENTIFNTKQGSLSVTDYYGTLNGLWIELDQNQGLKMNCTEDSATLTKFIERGRVFKFLSGLNSEYDPIRVQILGKDRLPSLSEVFYTVRGEESRRAIMLNNDNSSDGSALATGKGPIGGLSSEKTGSSSWKSSAKRDERWCTYCKKSGHTKDTCFKLHGRDKVLGRSGGFKGGQQRQVNQTVSDLVLEDTEVSAPPSGEAIPALSKAEMDRLRTLLDSISKPSGTCSLSMTAALAGANIVEIDLFGSLSESFSSNALDIVPSASTTSNPEGNVNLDSTASFAAVPSTSNNFNQSFEDPFGDSPFKAITSTESAPSQPQMHQSLEPSQLSHPNLEAVSNLGFGESFSVVPYSTSGASNTQPLSTNSQFLSPDFSTSPQETDILADILPPAPLPGMTSQQNFSASPYSQSSLSFSASSGKMASQSFFVQSGQLMQQDFSVATSQPAPQAFSGPTSQHAQQPFSAHVGQPTQSSDHMYGGFHSQAGSLTPVASSLFPQSQSGYNGPMNSGNYLPQRSTSTIPSHMAPQAPIGQLSQGANYFPQHGGSTAHSTSHFYKSQADQASQFNSGNFIAQQGNAAPSAHQPLPLHNASKIAVSSTGSNSLFSQPSKEKFETKSTVWADTLSRGLVNLNISGPKINPLADIGIDFDAINRKEKRMEKPTTTAVTSTVTMGKAMGSGSGIGHAGAGALRHSPNPIMGMGMGRGPGVGVGIGIGMESYGGMNAQMGMGVGRGVQMQPPPPTGLPPGSNINIPDNYNNSMMGTGIGGYPQHQQPYGGGGGGHR